MVATGDYGPSPSDDKHADIVWRNATTGKLVVWHMDGDVPPVRIAEEFTVPDSPANALDWTVVGPR